MAQFRQSGSETMKTFWRRYSVEPTGTTSGWLNGELARDREARVSLSALIETACMAERLTGPPKPEESYTLPAN